MKFFRRGQAALEFMMTYGWAILVVLAAIGALSYFGILNPARFTPNTCLATSGFSCAGKPIFDDTTIMFTLINGLGYKTTLDSSSLKFSNTIETCDTVYFCARGNITCDNSTRQVEDGSGTTVVISGCDFSELSVIKGDVTLYYLNPQSRLKESIIVSVTGKGSED